MDWIEVNLYTTSSAVETVCAVLSEVGITGVQIEDAAEMKSFLSTNSGQWDYVDESLLAAEDGEACVKFYLSDNASGRESLCAAKAAVGVLDGADFGRLAFETRIVDDEGWLNKWKEYYKPFEVGNVVIRPVWEEYDNPEGKVVFTINPGHVFGTGLHQSTQLCIERLGELAAGADILDLGCGSGILSIISLLLGANSALAVDIDPNAVSIAYENAKLNGIVENYRVLSGDVLKDESLRAEVCGRRYGVIAANIVADVIIALAGLAADCIADGGYFITSGIISQRLDDVRAALGEAGFGIVSEAFKDDWVCVVGRRI